MIQSKILCNRRNSELSNLVDVEEYTYLPTANTQIDIKTLLLNYQT